MMTQVEQVPHKKRRIIVCLDGTWDTPLERTNVYKFYTNINTDTTADDDWEYKSDYYYGLGTKSYILLGGAFGYGISDQIISAYEYACKNYQDAQDEIWLIGFSRGAFAARSLSGLIYNVGLLPEKNLAHAKKAYKLYRDRGEDTRPGHPKSVEFKKKYECVVPSIHFLGCFDTVGSLGVPKLPWYLGGSIFYSLFLGLHGFHDTKLTPIIKNAYHAMSIHDQRKWYRPTLMHFSAKAEADDHFDQLLEQVWFPGMHADVGGQKIGTSNNLESCHSLQWMMDKAIKHGIKFKPQDDCNTSSTFVYDDSYDSSIVYKLMPRTDRVIERDENTNEYMVSQLYKDGEFTKNFLTTEELNLYQSKTVDTFYQHIEEQGRLHE